MHSYKYKTTWRMLGGGGDLYSFILRLRITVSYLE
jgi:hypothetical protein